MQNVVVYHSSNIHCFDTPREALAFAIADEDHVGFALHTTEPDVAREVFTVLGMTDKISEYPYYPTYTVDQIVQILSSEPCNENEKHMQQLIQLKAQPTCVDYKAEVLAKYPDAEVEVETRVLSSICIACLSAPGMKTVNKIKPTSNEAVAAVWKKAYKQC